MATPIVIDTDPGVDDFIAIILALRSAELDLLGLTTTGGNVPLRHATRNALRTLEAVGRPDVPVAAGAPRPLRGSFHYASYFHGATGLSLRLPSPRALPVAQSAVDFLAATLETAVRPVALAALGPLTNIARLLERRPERARRIERLVVMGGAVDAPGNVTPHAEFNVWNDPDAARAVLRSGLPITLVGLDVCRKVSFTRADIDGRSGIVQRLLASWFSAQPERDVIDLCDPLTVACIIDAGLIETERVAIEVDVTERAERGRTKRAAEGARIDVAVGVDGERARGLIAGRVFE